MPQYSNTTTTPGGITVNSVLDTVSNTITITATTRNDSGGTVTFPVNGDLADAVISLRGQLSANEVISSTEISSGIRNAAISTVNNVKNQATSAAAVATETNTTVPAAPNPPPPISTADNSNLVQPNTNITNQANTVNYNNSSTSTAYDDDGNLNPGWAVDELGTVYFAGLGPPLTTPETTDGYQADPTTQTFDDGSSIQTFDDGSTLVTDADGNVTSTAENPGSTGSSRGLGGQTNEARSTATAQDTANFETKQDWRVRLSLAPSATYLYKAENPGILKPLKDTDGVIFPYLPTVNVSYIANYDPQELTHSNYKAYQYRSSSVEQVQITGDFTAQDTAEANYMLAVIHFFRSVTKMFYGQDQNPKPGTPPPLVFLYGLGDFQFNAHPLVVTTFNYSLPNDVDYIRASAPTLAAGVSTAGYTTASNSTSPTNSRLSSAGLNTGGTAAAPQFQTNSNSQPTYVPTKMQIQITALPMVTRNDISNNFSLKQYATGALLRGTQNKRAGIW